MQGQKAFKPEDLETGTTVVGVICDGAVIIGADRRTTAAINEPPGYRVHSDESSKIFELSPTIHCCVCGRYFSGKSIIDSVKPKISDVDVMEAANHLKNGTAEYLAEKKAPPDYEVLFLLAGVDQEGPHLYEINRSKENQHQFNSNYRVITGGKYTGKVLMGKRLPMSFNEALKTVLKAVYQAILEDEYSGGGIDLCVIRRNHEVTYHNIDLRSHLKEEQSIEFLKEELDIKDLINLMKPPLPQR